MKPLGINLRQLENHPVQLRGELPPEALEIETLDELIEVATPFHYDLQVELNGDALLITGWMELGLRCCCARCLKPFDQAVRLADWVASAALDDEESLHSVGDWVDLTPLLRDNLLLAFPQHPLCDASCGGLSLPSAGRDPKVDLAAGGEAGLSEWSALDRLKL